MSALTHPLHWAQGGAPTRHGYDLVIPPRTPPQEVFKSAGARHPYACSWRLTPNGSVAADVSHRPGSFFYFRGKIILDNPVYSQGVRQAVFRHHHEREGYVISDQSTKAFYMEMSSALFCFAPTGTRQRRPASSRHSSLIGGH